MIYKQERETMLKGYNLFYAKLRHAHKTKILRKKSFHRALKISDIVFTLLISVKMSTRFSTYEKDTVHAQLSLA